MDLDELARISAVSRYSVVVGPPVIVCSMGAAGAETPSHRRRRVQREQWLAGTRLGGRSGSLLRRFCGRTHFAIDTNINDLLSQRKSPLAATPSRFSQGVSSCKQTSWRSWMPTPELAQNAASSLVRDLNTHRRPQIQSASEGSSSTFFRRNGLLYLPDKELSATLSQLPRSGPLLGSLAAADPSLRGVMASMNLSLRGVQFRRISLETLAPFRALSRGD